MRALLLIFRAPGREQRGGCLSPLILTVCLMTPTPCFEPSSLDAARARIDATLTPIPAHLADQVAAAQTEMDADLFPLRATTDLPGGAA